METTLALSAIVRRHLFLNNWAASAQNDSHPSGAPPCNYRYYALRCIRIGNSSRGTVILRAALVASMSLGGVCAAGYASADSLPAKPGAQVAAARAIQLHRRVPTAGRKPGR